MRAEIREYARDALSMLGPTVYKSRGRAVVGTKIPFIVVYIPDEESRSETIGAGRRTVFRDARMRVEYCCEGSADTVEDELDRMAGDIETVLYSAPTFDGIIISLDLIRTESDISYGEGSDKALGIVQMTWLVKYRTNTGA